jgi:hypothetical protein
MARISERQAVPSRRRIQATWCSTVCRDEQLAADVAVWHAQQQQLGYS